MAEKTGFIKVKEQVEVGLKYEIPSRTEVVNQSVRLSPGAIDALCNGCDIYQKEVYQVENFVDGDPEVVPINSAVSDAYLATLGEPTLGQNGRAITLPIEPNLLQYHKNIGLVPEDIADRIVEVNPVVQEGRVRGYPDTDVTEQLYRSGRRLDGALFVAAFPTEPTLSRARAMGMEPAQSSNQRLATKTYLREQADNFEIKMTEGAVVYDEESLRAIADRLDRSGARKAWGKLGFASGGDDVISYSGPMTYEALLRVCQQVGSGFHKVFTEGTFDIDPESIWAAGAIAPHNGLVIERDAADEWNHLSGVTAQVCSNILEIHKDGRVRMMGDFEQLTENGSFIGSRSIKHEDAAILEALQTNNMGAAEFVIKKLGFYGILGTDYVVVKGRDGKVLSVPLLEINLRKPISKYAQAAADKLANRYGYDAPFINTNLIFPQPITSFAEFAKWATVPGVCSPYNTPEQGMVMPLAMRTLFVRRDDGVVVPASPNPVVKTLILGRDAAHTDAIKNALLARGIRV